MNIWYLLHLYNFLIVCMCLIVCSLFFYLSTSLSPSNPLGLGSFSFNRLQCISPRWQSTWMLGTYLCITFHQLQGILLQLEGLLTSLESYSLATGLLMHHLAWEHSLMKGACGRVWPVGFHRGGTAMRSLSRYQRWFAGRIFYFQRRCHNLKGER